MRVRLPGILIVVLLLASGCSNQDQENQEIRKTLSTRASALNSRNMAQYLSVVSLHYSDKNVQYKQLVERVEKNFVDFEQIAYEAPSPAITVEGSRAESVGSYRLKVLVRGKEMVLNGTEHLKLAKEPEGWKIIAGI